MKPMTEAIIRSSLINAGDDIAAQMTMPGLHEIMWESRDFLGWRDARAPQRAYLCYWREPPGATRVRADATSGEATPVTLMLRVPNGRPRADRLAICALCGTQQPAQQVRLFTAPKSGPAGEAGSTVGTYLCDDFSCSLTIRATPAHELQADLGSHIQRRIERLRARLDGFAGYVISSE